MTEANDPRIRHLIFQGVLSFGAGALAIFAAQNPGPDDFPTATIAIGAVFCLFGLLLFIAAISKAWGQSPFLDWLTLLLFVIIWNGGIAVFGVFFAYRAFGDLDSTTITVGDRMFYAFVAVLFFVLLGFGLWCMLPMLARSTVSLLSGSKDDNAADTDTGNE